MVNSWEATFTPTNVTSARCCISFKLNQLANGVMKKLSETYKELGIAFTFPIEIEDANGNQTYYESSRNYWCKREYDAKSNVTYYENSDDYWSKWERDSKGNITYYENSCGCKDGTPRSQSCAGKVIEVDGKKYKLTEL